MKSNLNLIGRNQKLFEEDVSTNELEVSQMIASSNFLVIGGAGTIGTAVVKEIFKRSPKNLDVVDISENNLVELVRDIRSSLGYIKGDFRTFALDVNSLEYDAFIKANNGYDYVLNLSALKHVRSEKDPYTLMRMIDVNIFNTAKTLEQSFEFKAKKYFCVSTDKAANPVNMMGASKRIMELFLQKYAERQQISTARFANVAFSDGSLLHSFEQRINKMQPLSAPSDIKRYFVTKQESGELCLMSALLGNNGDVFFPKLSEKLNLITFSDIAVRFLEARGYEAVICSSEEEARSKVSSLPKQGKWPCYFFKSDTTGEKDFEEFYVEGEKLDMETYRNIGVIKNGLQYDTSKTDYFINRISELKKRGQWEKNELVELFNFMLPEFNHKEKGKNLDQKM